MAGLTPNDLDLVELHDATSFAEIHLVEDLGLVSRSHPIGATGIMMLNELAVQLRSEAGKTQVPNARIAMAENGGGFAGLDIGLTATTILERVE